MFFELIKLKFNCVERACSSKDDVKGHSKTTWTHPKGFTAFRPHCRGEEESQSLANISLTGQCSLTDLTIEIKVKNSRAPSKHPATVTHSHLQKQCSKQGEIHCSYFSTTTPLDEAVVINKDWRQQTTGVSAAFCLITSARQV